jgi:integrase/recombinase XerD
MKAKYICVGKASYGLLFDDAADLYLPYQIFINHLKNRGYSNSTVNAYGEHVVRFLNYVAHASEVVDDSTVEDLRSIISSYTSYLLYAKDSSNPIANQIAVLANKETRTSLSSLLLIDAAVSYFVILGELEQTQTQTQTQTHLNTDPIFEQVSREISPAEKSKIKQNSMMAGVLSGALNKKQKSRLGILTYQRNKSGLSPVRSFDISLISDLISNFHSYRDKTLYSFLAASGCRSHEALQITLRDIDAKQETVELESPFGNNRDNSGLTESEIEQLTWKGRASSTTFLIEPFKSLFFKYLAEYIRIERISSVNHIFLFQNKKTNRPYFASDRSSRIKLFKIAAKKSGVDELFGISPHSLRHSYGIYTLNYLPSPNGQYGLPLPFVQLLMGHASIKSTAIYAKHDEEMLMSRIAQANNLMFGQQGIDLAEIRKSYHESELKKIESELKNLENKRGNK